jgi:hypothetical protein
MIPFLCRHIGGPWSRINDAEGDVNWFIGSTVSDG